MYVCRYVSGTCVSNSLPVSLGISVLLCQGVYLSGCPCLPACLPACLRVCLPISIYHNPTIFRSGFYSRSSLREGGLIRPVSVRYHQLLCVCVCVCVLPPAELQQQLVMLSELLDGLSFWICLALSLTHTDTHTHRLR